MACQNMSEPQSVSVLKKGAHTQDTWTLYGTLPTQNAITEPWASANL